MLNNYPVARPWKTLWYFLFFKNQVHRKLCWHFATSVWLKSWISDVKQVHFRERRRLEQPSHLKSLSGRLLWDFGQGHDGIECCIMILGGNQHWNFCCSLKWVCRFSSPNDPLLFYHTFTSQCLVAISQWGSGGSRVSSGCTGTRGELGRVLRSLAFSSRSIEMALAEGYSSLPFLKGRRRQGLTIPTVL